MSAEKEIKKQYIYSKKIMILIMVFVFLLLCVVGKCINSYLVIGGAVIYAFVSYIIFYNKMMAYIESKK